ncbi:MAG: DUF1878 family protein [Leuconostoc mesenteroides]
MDNELERIKYHQKMLLIVATSDDSEKTLFFQNIIAFDVSEQEVKAILKFVQEKDANGLKSFIEDNQLSYDFETILSDLITQKMLVNQAKEMLKYL